MKGSSERDGDLTAEEKRALVKKLLKQSQGKPDAFPMSSAQQRLWFLEQLAPDNRAYRTIRVFRLLGRLHEEALERSLHEIHRRHEICRTTYEARNGEPVQIAHEELPFRIGKKDFGELPASERKSALERVVTQELAGSLDLAAGPPWRADLIRLGDEEHMLAVTTHHILTDGWSQDVFDRELSVLYDAFSRSESPSLPELPLQYADFAAWQHRWFDSTEGQRQLAYWKSVLEGMPSILALPTDRPRPAIQSFAGARLPVRLPRRLTDATKDFSQREGVTLFVTLLASYQVLLYRYSGAADFAVGTPIANRDRRELEDLLGLFANTLVLRADLSGNPSFRELLQRLRETTLAAFARREMPFEKLVEQLQPDRDLSHNPLFQVAFVLHEPMARLELSGIEVTPVFVDPRSAKVDLLLSLLKSGGEIEGFIEYNTALYDDATIERLFGHYQALLEAALGDPERPISELPLLTREERRTLLVGWNRTDADFPGDRCLHQLIEAQAAERPEAVALEFREQRLTYAELNARANQLARHLRELGVEPDVLVGLCTERSVEMVVGMLGLLKAGGAYVPLDPSYPSERLAFMLRDSQSRVLLTQEPLLDELPEHEARVVCLDRDWDVISAESEENPEFEVSPENLAYAIYTSGSTGTPKGVLVPHRGLSNVSAEQARAFQIGPDSRVLQFSSLSFDASTFEIVMALPKGATLCLGTRESLLPGPNLLRFLRDRRITIVTLPPSALAALPSEDLPTLRTITVAGEACPAELVDAWAPGRGFFNLYGPTEATIWATTAECRPGAGPPPIGRPIANTRVVILDSSMQPVPVGVPGELHIAGVGLARGYLERPHLTAERFVPNPFQEIPGDRLYKSGDLARLLPDGNIEFLGRIDHQVKLRGFRIELGEIEAVLAKHPSVREAVVVAREDRQGDKQLVAYVVLRGPASWEALRGHLRELLPEFMLPAAFVGLETLPLSPNGKVDRAALPAPDTSRHLEADLVPPRSGLEEQIASIWRDALGLQQVGVNDNFFDLGGHSLLLTQVHARLQEEFHSDLPIVELFKYPTIAALATRLTGRVEAAQSRYDSDQARRPSSVPSTCEPIAIVGMAGRFPGARNLGDFWENLCKGVEATSFFSEEELRESGVPEALLRNENYVRAGAVLEDVDLFDAAFFGYTPREAQIIDPQQRFFLECAWEALDDAGYDATRYEGKIGVFAGVSRNTYQSLLRAAPEVRDSVTDFQLSMGADKDFLPTRTSYKIGLRGPSVAVQAACSTSLVAIHLAVQSLQNRDCDMALSGGSSIKLPQKVGYLYLEEGIQSPDGHCRAFDERAKGCVRGNGVGVVLLKRLSDAIAERDSIYAVIKGSAINNDGSLKVGYTAPSVDGQREVIASAQARSGLDPENIGFVEAHGTGTALGDPIEMAALTEAFRAHTQKKGFCAIGSVKTNIGHLDAAAGVASLIKTALSLKHGKLVPSLHFERPNPGIEFATSPFYVNTKFCEWERTGDVPRRAGVSSFGIGGTNAHAVLEEAPEPAPSSRSRDCQLLLLSARTPSALDEAAKDLAHWLVAHPSLELADVAYTLQVGRRGFERRRAVLCRDRDEAVELLSDPRHGWTSCAPERPGRVVFMFSGQGAQYPNMGRGLYETEPVFRQWLDICCDTLRPHVGRDLRELLFPSEAEGSAAETLARTEFSQPALFAIEYALARQWMAWGIQPEAMIGHSIGEYVAASLSGVLSLDDALALVAARGRLMASVPRGSMLVVALPEAELQPLLDASVSMAAVNGPSLCVASGPDEALAGLEAELTERGLDPRRLRTSHAFHSAMMDPILEAFTEEVSRVELKAPSIPYVSNSTGTWIRLDDATDPAYWTRHLRQTVRFSDGLTQLFEHTDRVLLEVGPGRTLATLASRHPQRPDEIQVLASLPAPDEQRSAVASVLESLGRLWCEGVESDWKAFYEGEVRNRVHLPSYPFQRKRYWVETERTPWSREERGGAPEKRPDVAEWFYVPSWRRSPLVTIRPRERERRWLVFCDSTGLGDGLCARLDEWGHDAVRVRAGEHFARRTDGSYAISPRRREDYDRLVAELIARDRLVTRVIHLWSVPALRGTSHGGELAPELLELGFYSVLHLVQALDDQNVADPWALTVVTSEAQEVVGDEAIRAEKAAVLGLCKVIPLESPHILCRSVDIAPENAEHAAPDLVDALLCEADLAGDDAVVAYRGGHRWVQGFEPVAFDAPKTLPAPLREKGIYLIIGGLGGLGLTLAEYLAQTTQARMALLDRFGLPARSEWDRWIAERGTEDPVSRRIDKVRALEALGSEVLVLRGSVANEAEMSAVFEETEAHFGGFHGVFHAAGAEKSGELIAELGREECERQFEPKMGGLVVLDRLLSKRDLDFCFVCSSLSSVLGVTGFASYTAAHLFMDAFVSGRRRAGGTRWIGVNWDNWKIGVDDERTLAPGLAEFLIEPQEGWEALGRILAASGRLSQVLVSTGDLSARLARWSQRIPMHGEDRADASGAAALHCRPDLRTEFVEPRNAVERTLADIWQKLLGIDRVGIHDSFFDLGGDSIVNINVVAKARRAGLKLTPKQVFEHHTIAELAPLCEASSQVVAEQGVVAGALPLTPIQHWFFDQAFPNPNHFNQAILLRAREPLELDRLKKALDHLLLHHDALRIRCKWDHSPVELRIGEAQAGADLDEIDLTALPMAERGAAIEAAAAEAQESLDLAHGPILRGVYFHGGPDELDRLLIVIHHLAVDIVSWGILLEDLETAYRQDCGGESIVLPAKTTSVKEWSERLLEYAQSSAMVDELDHWLALGEGPTSSLPLDENGANLAGSVETICVALAREPSAALLQEAHKAYNTHVVDLLLVALAEALSRFAGENSILVALEGHGREGIGDEVDLSRTVGWFTTLYPVRLDLPRDGDRSQTIKSVKERLRVLPNHGIGYGLLRYLHRDSEISERLKRLPHPQVLFLYKGRGDDRALPTDWILAPTSEPIGRTRAAEARREHVLEINAGVEDGRLRVLFHFSRNLHARETVETLARDFIRSLESLIEHCCSPEAGGYTPSDFPAARVSQALLDKLSARVGRSGKSEVE